MGKYWRLIGEYNAEDKTFGACVGAAQTSPYTPDMDGRLTGLRVIVGRDAATSLINHIQFRLTCTTFTPNTLHVAGQGAGIQTALIPQAGVTATLDWPCDQAVKAGVPITVEARNLTADTPVTVLAHLYGQFEG